MITASDSFNTYDLGKYYTILPNKPNWGINNFIEKFKAVKVEEGFSYNSAENSEWETVDSLRRLIKEHLYPNFE